MSKTQETHRPGAYKQVNKVHKTGRHRSKGVINANSKGKVSVKVISKRAKRELGKEVRRHQASQIRARKREEVLLKKRNLGSSESAPILILLLPLQEDLNGEDIVTSLIKADDEAIVSCSPCGSTHISLQRFKQRFTFVVPPAGDILLTLDLAKVATTILFVVEATYKINKTPRNEVIDSWGEEVLEALICQHLPTTMVAVTGLGSLPPKKQSEHKQHVQKKFSKWLPEEKIMSLDKPSDSLNIFRRAGSQKQQNVIYRDRRSYILADDVQFTCDEADDFGTLAVSGYLRGNPLSVNGLVHIPGFGDFQMTRIEAPQDPYALEKPKKGDDVPMEDCSVRILEEANPNKQESLKSENIPDPMDAEQTWPTEEELAEAKMKRKLVKLVPKGTSEYQAAWIQDEDADKNTDYDIDSEEDEMSVEEEDGSDFGDKADLEENEEYETMTVSEMAPNEQQYDEQMDMMEERQAMLKIKEGKLDAEFPDEVDTPLDTPAKTRFQKYRGLESFRSSPWDPKESLPSDYGRIFQFENFTRTRKRIFQERELLEGAMPGWYIRVHVAKVHRDLYNAYKKSSEKCLIMFGILENEHKMSTINVVLKRTNSSSEPIKSKETLIFQCGFRRFKANPIFSQHTNGNKHKYERFFQPGATTVATMYAPITFPPCPVLCYKQKTNGHLELIATGNLLSVNPDRLIIKRVVLSGALLKINKRSAVVRFMFYNRDDINWFKPIELRTKYGRRGHIKEPLGTHGHMKCTFDGQLNSQDTILMNLYKRVFPKWTYEPLLLNVNQYLDDNERME